MSNNLLVRDAAGSLLTMKSMEIGGVHTPYQLVGSIEKKFRDSFVGVALDTSKWDLLSGAGTSITVSSGLLTLNSGTTASSEISITTTETFQAPFRVSFNAGLSQRIANQSFLVEAVSVDPVTLIPDGLNSCGLLFDGTTATTAKYSVQNGGLAKLVSAASTFVTTTGSVGVYELEPFADECWFHSTTLDSTAGRSNSYRRHQQIPDPNAVYKVRISWVNGSTAPATSTAALLQFVAVQDYQELTAEITAGRGQSSAGQAMAVAVTTMPTVTANAVAQNNIFYNDSTTNQAASATLTGTARDVGVAAATAHRYTYFNAFVLSDQVGTMRIECSNDNATWRRATTDTAVSANTPLTLNALVMTRYYRVVYINGAVLTTVFMLNTSYTAA